MILDFILHKMKNITFSADESLIQKARDKAEQENSTLNNKFRKWLQEYVTWDVKEDHIKNILSKVSNSTSGKSFLRDELNQR